MPYVNISVVGPSPTSSQKQALFSEITDLMVNVLHRNRRLVVVSVTSSLASDVAVGGVTQSAAPDAFLGAQAVIHVLAGTNSDEQKAKMIAETSEVLRKTLGEPTLPLYVTFDETPPASWGYNGKTVAAIQAANAS